MSSQHLAVALFGALVLAGCAEAAPPEEGQTAPTTIAASVTTAGPTSTGSSDTGPPATAPTTTEHQIISALADMTDPAFAPPLVDVELIIESGVEPDGIRPVDDPHYTAVSKVQFLDDEEPVLVLDVNGDVRAFPIMVMTWHELVNDTIGGVPVTVSFCPLCNSGVAFERTTDFGELTFGTSGRLFNSSLVMYDRQTESLWTHFDGRAVVGTLTGSTLTRLPMQTVSWATFRDAFPDAEVLNRNTGINRPYGRNPYPGYDSVDSQPFFFVGEIDGRVAAKERVVAIRGAETKVILTTALAEAGTVEFDLDGVPLVAVHLPGTVSALDGPLITDGRDIGATGVFRRDLDGVAVSLTVDGDVFVDEVSGSRFDVLGTAIDGPLAGSRLERVETLDTFWFAIAAFDPDTTIVDPS